jgi:3-hydroxyisobutyrate dehydrogenase-like beta-hydroxyacid dehydrogenase
MASLAFLGTGLIGGALAQAAAQRGDSVSAWNRTAEKARALAEHGVRAVDSPIAAVQGAERVHVTLSDDAAVDEVLAACGDALSGKIVIDHTTASPEGTARRMQRLAQHGVEFLHAPVFMSPAMARQARGIILVSGASATFERVKPELEKMTGSVEYYGERPELAAAYKLMGNAMIFAITGGVADVLQIASAVGIAPGDALGLFAKFNPAVTLQYRGAQMARGDYTPGFELTMARKDARLMIQTAENAGKRLRSIPALAAWMDELVAAGHGARDLGVLAIDAVPERR